MLARALMNMHGVVYPLYYASTPSGRGLYEGVLPKYVIVTIICCFWWLICIDFICTLFPSYNKHIIRYKLHVHCIRSFRHVFMKGHSIHVF